MNVKKFNKNSNLGALSKTLLYVAILSTNKTEKAFSQWPRVLFSSMTVLLKTLEIRSRTLSFFKWGKILSSKKDFILGARKDFVLRARKDFILCSKITTRSRRILSILGLRGFAYSRSKIMQMASASKIWFRRFYVLNVKFLTASLPLFMRIFVVSLPVRRPQGGVAAVLLKRKDFRKNHATIFHRTLQSTSAP